LNRVVNSTQASAINGNLLANGKIFVINQNGVLLGKTANVNTTGFIASTADITNNAFMNSTGTYDFNIAGNANASVTNKGHISVQDAGLVAFVAPHVSNEGLIEGNLAKVQLGAGDMYGVDLYGDGLISLAVTTPQGGAKRKLSADNSGSIITDGGKVYMTAAAASNVVDSVINNTGVIQAQGLTAKNGEVILTGAGAHVKVSGKIDVSGKNGGGKVKIGGDYQGKGTLAHAAITEVTSGAVINASATETGDGGTIVVWGDEATYFQGTALAQGGANSGNGGLVETSSEGYLNIHGGSVNTSAANGEFGTWLLDPLDVQIFGGTNDGTDTNTSNNSTTLNPINTTYLASPTTLTVYESEIEGQSATTNITIQATHSVTTSGSGTVTLANNSNLTIQTRNNAGDGTASTGRIDLSNLEFATTGTGSITLAASTGTGSGNITVGKLTSETGAINISTDNGTIDLNNTITSTSGNVTASASGNLSTGASGSITTGGTGTISLTSASHAGNITAGKLTSGGDISITTNGGSITFNGDINISNGGAGLTATAGESGTDIAGILQAGSGDISMTGHYIRTNNGQVLLRSGNSIGITGNSKLYTRGGNVTMESGDITINNSDIGTGGGAVAITALDREHTSGDVSINDTIINTVGGSSTGTFFLWENGTDFAAAIGATDASNASTFGNSNVFHKAVSPEKGGNIRIDGKTIGKNNNCFTSGGASCAVTDPWARALTITADGGQTKIYGSLDSTFTYTSSIALLSGDYFTGALARVAGENAGSYYINQGTLSIGGTGLYTITYVGAQFVVTPYVLTVMANANGKTYGDADTALTYTHGSLTNGDTDSVFTGALNRDAGEDVAAYAINKNTLSAGGNYTIDYTGANFTITPALLTVLIDSQSREYGLDNDPLDAHVTGFKNGDTDDDGIIDGDLVTTATQSSNVGDYIITAINVILNSTNYTYEIIDGTLHVTPKGLLITAHNDSKTYDGLAYTGGNGVDYLGFVLGQDETSLGGSLTYGGTAIGSRNAGNYILSAGGYTSSNYDITFNPGILSVAKRDLTIQAVTDTKFYDGNTSSTVLATQTGLQTGDTLVLGAQTFDDKNAGARTVSVGGFTLTDGNLHNNYNITYNKSIAGYINQALLSLKDVFADNKEYDGGTHADIHATLDGVVGTEDIRLVALNAAFDDKNVADDKNVHFTSIGLSGANNLPEGLSNYNYSAVFDWIYPTHDIFANITPKALTISAVSDSREYNGTTSSVGTPTFDGLVTGVDSLTELYQTFNSPNVMGLNGSTLSVANDYNLDDGNGGHNYDVTLETASGTISQRELDITANSDSKVYGQEYTFNGSEYSQTGLLTDFDSISSVDLTSDGAPVTAGVNGGIPYDIVASDVTGDNITTNYSIEYHNGGLTVTPKGLYLTDVTAHDKVYDAETDAEITGELDGVINEDDVQISSISGYFDDKNVGEDKDVYFNNVNLTGEDAGNYFAYGPEEYLYADITKAPLTITAVYDSKTYDGTTDSDETPEVYTAEGSEDEPEVLGLLGDDADGYIDDLRQRFDSKNAGERKLEVIETALIDDEDGRTGFTIYDYDDEDVTGNYDITYLKADGYINKASLHLRGVSAEDKTYDGTTVAQLDTSEAELSGIISVYHEGDGESEDYGFYTKDDVTFVGGTGEFDSKNVGYNKRVRASDFTLAGIDAENYELCQPGRLRADITPKGLTITANDDKKTYDGQEYAGHDDDGGNGDGNGVTYDGFVEGEDETVLTGELSYGGDSQEAVQVGKYDITLGGYDSAEYHEGEDEGDGYYTYGYEDRKRDYDGEGGGDDFERNYNYFITYVDGILNINAANHIPTFRTDSLGRPFSSIANNEIELDESFEPVETGRRDIDLRAPRPNAGTLANLEPAGGGSSDAEDLADIEPAAGGDTGVGGGSPTGDIVCANAFLADKPCTEQ
jgi:hypothetical protein